MEELRRLAEARDKAAERLLWCIQMAATMWRIIRTAGGGNEPMVIDSIADKMKSYWANQNNLSER